ncbi:MAG: hypothetical protein ABJA02_14140, partial [Acidobacteriota bacterium]
AGFADVTIRSNGLSVMEILNYFFPRKNVGEPFDRVESDHRLNENLTRTPLRKAVKTVLNHSLSITRLGDSLKIYARK